MSFIVRPFFVLLVMLMPMVGNVQAADAPRLVELELVTDNAAPGDGGNAWGGHQCRIVRTVDGVFTTYTVPGQNETSREWKLAGRIGDRWQVLAQGLAGREPANLLAAPDGTLHVLAWPDGRARLWSGRPNQGVLTMTEEAIPDLPIGHWSYSSACIDRTGNIFVLSSRGSKPGAFHWARREAATGKWVAQVTDLDYRHCYSYLLPDETGGLAIVSTRDVTWETLGYAKPEGKFGYAFNAFGLWRTASPTIEPLVRLTTLAEEPTHEQPYVFCNAQSDAFLDGRGRLHVVYRRIGASTGGREVDRHAVFSLEGKTLFDGVIPPQAGIFCRMFQDDRAQLYLLGSSGVIYPMTDDDFTLGTGTPLDLGGNKVEYSGFAVAAPRGGTLPGNAVDVVFPTGEMRKWIYGRILLYAAP